MKIQKFRSEFAFTLHQKIMLIGFSLIILLILIELINQNLNLIGYLLFFFFLILFLFLLALTFSKKELIKKNKKLYKAKSFLGVTLLKRKVNLSDRPVVSILKFKKNQKFAFVSAARPDQADSFNSFEIFLLNENHTKRDSIIYFKKEENANNAIAFFINNFPLKYEIFSPRFD